MREEIKSAGERERERSRESMIECKRVEDLELASCKKRDETGRIPWYSVEKWRTGHKRGSCG